jgi:(p)ppGpp synthase/HD superfamily hydrolase
MLLSARFEEALRYACVIHAGQTRKSTEVPYVAHLLAVAALALETGATEDEAIAALLHDAAEDCGGRERLDDVRLRFGEPVARVVEECTDTFERAKPPWRPRKEAYLRHLGKTTCTSALVVSCCDKLHNARSILADLRRQGEATWSKFNGGRDGTLWYYRSLVDAFRGRVDPRLHDELERTVAAIEKEARRT